MMLRTPFVCLCGLLVATFASQTLAYDAVLAGGHQPLLSLSREYSIAFLDDDLEFDHAVQIGSHGVRPEIAWSPDGRVFMYTGSVKGERGLFQFGYAVEDRKEVFRIPLGRVPIKDPTMQRVWAGFSDDQRFLYVQKGVRGRWALGIYHGRTYAHIGDVVFDKGFYIGFEHLAGGRLLAVSDHVNRDFKRAYIVDATTAKVLHEVKLDNPGQAVAAAPDGRHVYLLRTEKVRRPDPDHPHVQLKFYRAFASAFDVSTGRVGDEVKLGYGATAFVGEEDSNELYLAVHRLMTKPGGRVWRFENGEISEHAVFSEVCEPTNVLLRDKGADTTVLCKSHVVHLAGDRIAHAKLPFEMSAGTYAPDGQSVYTLAARDSRMGKIQLSPLKFVESRATGRFGVKLGNAVGALAGLGLAVTTGYGYLFMPIYSSTDVMVDGAGRFVYGLNAATADVTIARTDTFEVAGKVPAGNGLMFLYRFDGASAVFAMSDGKVTKFNPLTGEPAFVIEDGTFAGARADLDRVYWAPKSGGLQIYAASTGQVVRSYAEIEGEILGVLSYRAP